MPPEIEPVACFHMQWALLMAYNILMVTKSFYHLSLSVSLVLAIIPIGSIIFRAMGA